MRYQTIGCPHCAAIAVVPVPEDRFLDRHVCEACGTEIRPKPGDACLFISYGTGGCPCGPGQPESE